MKVLQVTMSDSTVWEIEARIIAMHRAHYFASKEKPLYYRNVYNIEYKVTINDDNKLLDWASNNMNWIEIRGSAKQVLKNDIPPSYEHDWCNAPKEIIEIEQRDSYHSNA